MNVVLNGSPEEMQAAAVKLAGQGDPNVLAPALIKGAQAVNQTRVPESATGAVNVQPAETPFIPMQGAQGVAPGYTPPAQNPPPQEPPPAPDMEDEKQKEWSQAMMAFAEQQQQKQRTQGSGMVAPGSSIAGGGGAVNLQTPGLYNGQQIDPIAGLLARLRAGGY